MILFSQISDRLRYPPDIKAKASSLHSVVIAYVSEHFVNTKKYKQQVIGVMNSISYYTVHKDSIDDIFDANNPLNLKLVDDDICKSTLGNLYIPLTMIKWDIEESESAEDTQNNAQPIAFTEIPTSISVIPTPKEHLYIQNPIVPRFDYNKVFISGRVDNEDYVIYSSLPEVPLKQCDISATTDISGLSESDFLGLYPNQFIPTRASCMYDKSACPEGFFDKNLGYIIPIDGYSSEEVLNNIIEYPHFYKLMKCVDGSIVNFYDSIEIDGELYNTLDIWDELSVSKILPKTSEFIKEYVVRRYLLERDIRGISHKYPMFGTLDKFLTLFMPFEMYKLFGYSGFVDIAKQCVASRISYKKSRNPIIRRLMTV